VLDQPRQEQLDQLYKENYFNSNKYRDINTLNKELLLRLQLMQQNIPVAGARVLEVGCGSGEFIYLAKDYYDMSGFDISEAAIKIARERNPLLSEHLWVEKEGEQSNLIPEYYDAICAWDVIEHLWAPVFTFQRLIKCLKPGGYLFIIRVLRALILGLHMSFETLFAFTFLGVSGFQSLLFAMWMDIQDNERLYK